MMPVEADGALLSSAGRMSSVVAAQASIIITAGSR